MSSKSISTMLPQITFALEEFVRSTNGLAQPIEIMGVGMEFMERYSHLTGAEKKDLLIKTLECIAVGKDNIPDTSDDVIPSKTVNAIRILLDNGFAEQTIDLVASISKGKLNINKQVAQVAEIVQKTGCFGCMKS